MNQKDMNQKETTWMQIVGLLIGLAIIIAAIVLMFIGKEGEENTQQTMLLAACGTTILILSLTVVGRKRR